MRGLKLYSIIFLFCGALTLIIFQHRILNLTTHYGLDNVDTDGTLWYYWAKSNAHEKRLSFDFNDFLSYPYGYDLSYIPFDSLVYDINIGLINILGPSIKSIVVVSNIASLISYPLSALAMFGLAYYLTRRVFSSLIASLVFSFSYYHVLMGRGSLSTNHIYFIPLYFLTIFYYLNNKNYRNLLISSTILALCFWANAYWAFFCGILSIPIFAFYLKNKAFDKVKTLVLYMFVSGIITMAINANFFNHQFYNVRNNERQKSGRTVNSESELVSLINIVAPSNKTILYEGIGNGGDWFLGYTAIILGFSGLLTIKTKPRTYYLVVVLFLLTIVLQAKTPITVVFSDFYFATFGFFRAVSRLTVLSSMFLGLLVAISLGETIERDRVNNIKVVILIIIGFFVILEGLNKEASWYKMTPISSIDAHYSTIRNDTKIKSLASYPMKLSNGDNGLPPNYQLLAQIVHNKKLVGGASPFQTEVLEYHNLVKNPLETTTVNILEEHGVDAIVIYYKRTGLHTSENLKTNDKLTYKGRYEYAENPTYNYDLFYVKQNYESNNKTVLQKSENKHELQGTVYENYLVLPKTSKTLSITQHYPYNKNFSLYTYNKAPYFVNLFRRPINTDSHYRNELFENEWSLETYEENNMEISSIYKPLAIESLYNLLRYIALIIVFGLVGCKTIASRRNFRKEA